MKMILARAMDASAIGLSALCLVHCLALPALALALPFLGAWSHAEWVHVVFICAAAPIALTALMDWRMLRPHAWALVALAALGLGLMLAGALEVPSAGWERPLTVIGGVILATAHILNWRRRPRSPRVFMIRTATFSEPTRRGDLDMSRLWVSPEK